MLAEKALRKTQFYNLSTPMRNNLLGVGPRSQMEPYLKLTYEVIIFYHINGDRYRCRNAP
jgi:hypothetical protein